MNYNALRLGSVSVPILRRSIPWWSVQSRVLRGRGVTHFQLPSRSLVLSHLPKSYGAVEVVEMELVMR